MSASQDAEPAKPEGVVAAYSGSEEPAEHEHPAAAEASSQPHKKRKKVDGCPIQGLLQEFWESQKEREERSKAKMSLLERLVAAVESQGGQNCE